MAKLKVLGPKAFDQRFLRKYEIDFDAMGGFFTLNSRKTNCKRCGCDLESEEGIKIMATSNGWHYRRFFLCIACVMSVRQVMVMPCIGPDEYSTAIECHRKNLGLSINDVVKRIDENFEYAKT